jgi:hypothetical protein
MIVKPVAEFGGLKENVTVAGLTPVTRAESVHCPPPARLQPLPDPADAPSVTSVSACPTAAAPSSSTQNPIEKDR